MAAESPLLVAFLAFSCLAVTARADEKSDSLAYEAKRTQVLEHGPDERQGAILGAAQDLARDGFYAEALDVIFSMQDTSEADWESAFDEAMDSAALSGMGRATVGPGAGKIYGYVETGAGIERWEDLDTTIVGGHVRAKLEWDPPGSGFDRLSAETQFSDRNSYFDFVTKGAVLRRMIKFETQALAEKKLWQSYGDSLDRLYLLGRMDLTTRPLGKPLAFEAPGYVAAELFRHEKFGSQSYRSAGITPGLQAMSENTAKFILLSWELRGTQYPSADASSNFSDGPVASGWWYGERLSLDAETRFTTTRYNRDSSLFRTRRLETLAGGSLRTLRWLKLGLRTSGLSDLEDWEESVARSVDTVSVDFRLTGSSWMLRPEVTAEWAGAYSTSLACAFTRGRYPVLEESEGIAFPYPHFITPSSDDWKYQAVFTMLTKAIFMTLSVDYEVNWVPYSPLIYSVGTSKGAGLDCNLHWNLWRWLELDFNSTATRRLELAEGFTSGYISSNTLVSLGLTARLP